MESLITRFLNQNHLCPLPGIGTLRLVHHTAMLHPGENRISSPYYRIELVENELDPELFVNFIAEQKNIHLSEAEIILKSFCSGMLQLNKMDEVNLPATGSFYINEPGKLFFRQFDLPDFFHLDIHLKKVIHPESVHAVRVGDTDTTSQKMNRYYQPSKKVTTSNSWFVFVALLLLLIFVIVFYLNNPKDFSDFDDFNLFSSP
ncbi:MAG: hypothetical protein FGM46_07945 [Ferruginibacter sp.]|nr:hypothetical protein [Ferruginibacter sp.]